LRARFPNSDTMDSTHTASLDIPELSQAISISYFFPGMAHQCLLSEEHICNEGYCVTISIDAIKIYNYTGKAILRGGGDI
jgi:hypothetical protein